MHDAAQGNVAQRWGEMRNGSNHMQCTLEPYSMWRYSSQVEAVSNIDRNRIFGIRHHRIVKGVGRVFVSPIFKFSRISTLDIPTHWTQDTTFTSNKAQECAPALFGHSRKATPAKTFAWQRSNLTVLRGEVDRISSNDYIFHFTINQETIPSSISPSSIVSSLSCS